MDQHKSTSGQPSSNGEDAAADLIRIGSAELRPSTGELVREGGIVLLGRRALKLLMVLHDARGAMVSNEELLRVVWAASIVEQNTLQSHISSLRRALGNDRDRLKTFSGRGYRLDTGVRGSASVNEPEMPKASATGSNTQVEAPHTLPSPPSSLIGRDDAVDALRALIRTERILTLTGPGGIGKTRLALEAAWRATQDFPGGAFFVDLSSIISETDVAPAVMSSIGSERDFHVSIEDRVRGLGHAPVLIVVDNCEHVIEVAADVIETIARSNPAVRLIATSREPLRIDGECVFPVAPLTLPSPGATSHADLLECGATQLFIGRSALGMACIGDNTAVLPLIVDICTRLDGNPLAIELAAARADSIGIDEVATRLDDSLSILVNGKRTALPRHQTLRATLAWSYGLLSAEQRVIFRRLAVFAGGFTLDSACSVLAGSEFSEGDVLDHVSNLVTKSLLTTYVDWSKRRYRFLEMTRSYALELLMRSGEHERVATMHARHYTEVLDTSKVGINVTVVEFARTIFLPEFDNARAAMNWAFSEFGDPRIGLALTSSITPAMYELLFLEECAAAATRALAALNGDAEFDRAMELRIRTSLAASLVYLRGPAQTIAVWEEVLRLAYTLNAASFQVRALWGLWTCSVYSAAPAVALQHAQEYGRVAKSLPPDNNVAKYIDRMMGISYHYLGDQVEARRHLDTFISVYDHGRHFVPLGNFIDHAALARATLARVLWFLGLFDRARETVARAVAEALSENNPLTICYVLVEGALPISLQLEDFDAARAHLMLLQAAAERHGSMFWKLLAKCYEVILDSQAGVSADAPALLRASIEGLHAQAYDTYAIDLRNWLAHLMHRLGRTDEALALTQRSLEHVAKTGERLWEPELLRSRALFARASTTLTSAGDAERDLREAIALARIQGSLALELRAAIQLSADLVDHGKREEALQLLTRVHDRFIGNQQAPDLQRARRMIEAFG